MIQKGTKVKWKWGTDYAYGKLTYTFTKTITKTLKGSEITRHGEEGNKALLIKQEDGTEVLKLENEVERAASSGRGTG